MIILSSRSADRNRRTPWLSTILKLCVTCSQQLVEGSHGSSASCRCVATCRSEYISPQYRPRETLRITQNDRSGHERGQSLPHIQVPCKVPSHYTNALLSHDSHPSPLSLHQLAPSMRASHLHQVPVSWTEMVRFRSPLLITTCRKSLAVPTRVVDGVPIVKQEPQEPQGPMSAVIVSLCHFLFGHIPA